MIRSLFVVIVLLSSALSGALAADEFRIKSLREMRSSDQIEVNNAWLKEPKRLLVTLRVENDTPASTIAVKIYLFDKDGKQVAKVEKPNAVWMQTARGSEAVGLPEMLPKNKDIDVYFALTAELEVKKWKSIVAVFGNQTVVAARSTPATAINTLEFPEKSRMIKDQK